MRPELQVVEIEQRLSAILATIRSHRWEYDAKVAMCNASRGMVAAQRSDGYHAVAAAASDAIDAAVASVGAAKEVAQADLDLRTEGSFERAYAALCGSEVAVRCAIKAYYCVSKWREG